MVKKLPRNAWGKWHFGHYLLAGYSATACSSIRNKNNPPPIHDFFDENSYVLEFFPIQCDQFLRKCWQLHWHWNIIKLIYVCFKSYFYLLKISQTSWWYRSQSGAICQIKFMTYTAALPYCSLELKVLTTHELIIRNNEITKLFMMGKSISFKNLAIILPLEDF